MTSESSGQRTDSIFVGEGPQGDSLFIIPKNIPKSILWGNSWYASTSCNYSKTNEFDLNIGRTYGSSMCAGVCNFTMRSRGAGFGVLTKNGKTNQIAKAFWEYTFFISPPASAGLRADYMYDITNNLHYLRPSAGLSLFYVDIFNKY